MRISKQYIICNDGASGSCDDQVPLLENSNEHLDYRSLKGWPSATFNVVRRVYQQEDLHKDADYQEPISNIKRTAKKLFWKCNFGSCLKNSIPIIHWLPKYKWRSYLVGDLVAGATVAVMHIPQGMAYAILGEIPPIVGLYMAFFPVLMYIALGTSPHISMGTFALCLLMSGKVVNRISFPDEEVLQNSTGTFQLTDDIPPIYTPMEVTTALAMMCGIFQVSMWLFRMGAISSLLSDPLVSGFTTAASFHVLASQLKDLFGVQLPKRKGNFKVIITIIDICSHLSMLNWVAVIISVISITVMSLNNEVLKPRLRKLCIFPVPIELILVVVGTLVSRFADLKGSYNLNLVGNIPTGFPEPKLPPLSLFPLIAVDALVITMVTYTISMSMALIFASKEKYEVDANQELLAIGASNIFGSLFSCGALCASLSRSNIQYQAGAKTNITSLVSCSILVFVLLWIGPFFELLPRCVLASIIVVALKGMFMQVKELVKFWKLSLLDAAVWLITFLVVVIVNIDIGLGVGMVASLGVLFVRAQRPYTCLLGRVKSTDIYLDVKRYKAAEEIPGIKIFHYCGGLNFASKHAFRTTLFRKTGVLEQIREVSHEVSTSSKSDGSTWENATVPRIGCVIIDMTAMSYVDAPGVKMICSVKADLVGQGINVFIAGANVPVLEMIKRHNNLESEKLQIQTFHTVHDAVVYYNHNQERIQKNVTINLNT